MTITKPAWVQNWLDLQCKMIAGISGGLVMLGRPEHGSVRRVAHWPTGDEKFPELTSIAKQAFCERRQIFRGSNDDISSPSQLACPLLLDGQLIGVVALSIDHCTDHQQKTALQLLQWGTAWLEVLVRQQTKATNRRLLDAMELVTVCVEQEHFQAAATAVATELARRLDCDRVSFGFRLAGRMEVLTQSHTARVKSRTNLNRDIGVAMDEAVDQGSVIVYPTGAGTESGLSPSHEKLSRNAQVQAICTVPLTCRGKIVGAMTLERVVAVAFSARDLELCEYIGGLVGPILELQRKEDRWLGTKILGSFGSLISRLFGPRNAGLKLATICISALVLFLSLASGDYKVASRASLEGSVQRVVVAPLQGFVATAKVRAGDVVQQGQVMATLDDKDLTLEKLKRSSEESQLLREHRSALASHNRAQTSILSAQLDQTRAQLELLGAQLARTRLLAPFDGVVVYGDLSQALGAPVERGDVLFRVAPLNSYRIVLNVDERDIGVIVAGQAGHLALSSLPGHVYPFSVEKITPVAEAADGQNYFRVEAKLDDSPEFLRPGMEGIGKIEIGDRKLIWIWSHRMLDWLRLWSWSWLS